MKRRTMIMVRYDDRIVDEIRLQKGRYIKTR